METQGTESSGREMAQAENPRGLKGRLPATVGGRFFTGRRLFADDPGNG